MSKICIKYDAPNTKYIDEANQIKVMFRPEDETFGKYIEVNQDKRIYIEVNQVDFFNHAEYGKLLMDLKKFKNWVLQIPLSLLIDEQTKTINNNRFNILQGICDKYMFTDLIGQWEVLQFVLSLHPEEVYITNILGFCLPDVRKVCGEVGVRVYANWAQSAWDGTPAIKKFFIRPEDLQEYEMYVSGIEFQGDKTIQEVCYEVYKRGYWYGNLSELIIGLGDSLDSRQLPHNFGALRTECKKRCITGGNCSVCRSMIKFTEAMEKTNSEVVPRKN